MAKTFTDLQKRIMARAISQSVSETVWLMKGHIASVRSLVEKGFIDKSCYTMLQNHHVTAEGRAAFFAEHGDVFAIQDIYDNCWLVFEDREVITKPRSERAANRIVKALLALREIASPLSRMDTPTDKAKSEEQADDIMADLSDDRLCSDANALYSLIREARKIAA
jgi:hypothetical protein